MTFRLFKLTNQETRMYKIPLKKAITSYILREKIDFTLRQEFKEIEQVKFTDQMQSIEIYSDKKPNVKKIEQLLKVQFNLEFTKNIIKPIISITPKGQIAIEFSRLKRFFAAALSAAGILLLLSTISIETVTGNTSDSTKNFELLGYIFEFGIDFKITGHLILGILLLVVSYLFTDKQNYRVIAEQYITVVERIARVLTNLVTLGLLHLLVELESVESSSGIMLLTIATLASTALLFKAFSSSDRYDSLNPLLIWNRFMYKVLQVVPSKEFVNQFARGVILSQIYNLPKIAALFVAILSRDLNSFIIFWIAYEVIDLIGIQISEILTNKIELQVPYRALDLARLCLNLLFGFFSLYLASGIIYLTQDITWNTIDLGENLETFAYLMFTIALFIGIGKLARRGDNSAENYIKLSLMIPAIIYVLSRIISASLFI